MGRVPSNIIANLVGQGWTAAMTLLLVPVYVRVLGVEAYGLVGLYATLQASLQLLDLGLGQTTNRNLARFLAFPDTEGEARDFVRTVEIGYWAIGTVAGIALVAAAPLVVKHWLNVGALPVDATIRAVRLMGLVVALQWPLSLYGGAMMGLQRQVLLNALKVANATVSGVGSILVLLLLSPSVTAYFAWQAVSAALGVGIFASVLWRSLLRSKVRARFRPGLVVAQWKLAAGIGTLAVAGIVLAQVDKVLLSRLLPLEAFGYYTLASVAANAVPLLIAGPLFTAIFPRLTTLVALESRSELVLLYHRGTQLMAVLVASGAGVIAAFSFEIMRVWTRSETTASVTAPVVTLLVAGMAANALATMPFTLQLAHGWTSMGVRLTIGLILLLVPTIVVMTLRFGPRGAATAWLVLNCIYLAAVVPLTHRRLLKGEVRAWLLDVLAPVAAATIVLTLARWILRPAGGGLSVVLQVGAAALVALAAATLAAPLVRRGLLHEVSRACGALE